jgi:hypothetical protein
MARSMCQMISDHSQSVLCRRSRHLQVPCRVAQRQGSDRVRSEKENTQPLRKPQSSAICKAFFQNLAPIIVPTPWP